ncbi:MAG: transcriptional repressor LexA [Phycisphaerales bacterium]|nr:MAG: transcriptional repressor LexA [Phycisphaerales bacterium]
MRLELGEPIDGLTPRQIEVLRLIACFCDRQRYSPTMAELAGELGLSRSTVFEHLGELQRKGLLSTSPGKARSLKVTSRGRRLLEQTGGVEPDVDDEPRGDVPLLGRIAAGLPREAVENTESISLESCFGLGDDLFALEVSGDSMIEENIEPGDYVICRRTNTADNGELVVALVDDGEATLKRFYKESHRIRLQPANGNYEPIYTNNCHIEGVVVGLVRRL